MSGGTERGAWAGCWTTAWPSLLFILLWDAPFAASLTLPNALIHFLAGVWKFFGGPSHRGAVVSVQPSGLKWLSRGAVVPAGSRGGAERRRLSPASRARPWPRGPGRAGTGVAARAGTAGLGVSRSGGAGPAGQHRCQRPPGNLLCRQNASQQALESAWEGR